ncbi:MAG: RNA-binding protein [Chitinophagaceae bacterium]|nr:MAG: RNA-binding protein [Chitinophagaceae bacterium]
MNLTIYNLDAAVTKESLSTLFTPFGTVESAEIAMDVFTGSSRGYGHVTMTDDDAARAAITALNGTQWQGHALTVEEATPAAEHRGSYKVGSGPVRIYKFRKQ